MEKCEPKAIIENGKVVNADKLRHYWEERNRLNYRMRRGMFADLEALSELSQPEREPEPKIIFRPRPVDKEIDQLKVQVLHLQSKVIEYLKQKKAETPKASKPDRVDVTDRYYR